MEATNISISTYQRISKEGDKIDKGASSSFETPHKKRPRKSRVIDGISTGVRQRIREIVYDFYIVEKKAPTLKCM